MADDRRVALGMADDSLHCCAGSLFSVGTFHSLDCSRRWKQRETQPQQEAALRPTFGRIYMDLAYSLALRSTCERGLKVGCVITSSDFRKVLAIGYNGNATGLKNGCDRHGAEAVGNCGCLHAEENAAIHCDVPRQTPKLVFCTHLPCNGCAKRLINLGGVTHVWYDHDYRIKDAVKTLRSVGVVVQRLGADGRTVCGVRRQDPYQSMMDNVCIGSFAHAGEHYEAAMIESRDS